jgi:ABC-2 type transport system ATP-binding protein
MASTHPHPGSAVELRDLTRTFRAPGGETVRAVDGVDLTIAPGEVVAFLGPNGAGKTTTLDLLLGLTEPTSGTVRVFGQPPRKAIAAGRVSAVLQTGGLLRDLTVAETVRMIASTYERHAPVGEVLERAGVTVLARRRVAKLSGGEQQRLRFALALLPDPDLVVLDEPTAGMDVSARREFWDTMHADALAGRTVVFATHYLEEAEAFARRTVMIAGGRIVADGPTAEVRARAAGRTVSADLPDDPTLASRGLRLLHGIPDVHEVTTTGRRVRVVARDSDRVARLLLTDLGLTGLEVTSGSLESAFLAITATETQEVPA